MAKATPTTKRRPCLGCIADDVTGATDLALNLVQGGMCVVQLLDIPTAEELESIEADAVVMALKTRSIAKELAVSSSLEALDALRKFGVRRFFFKYCSTFDSTDEGNIGPVAEGLLAALGAPQTIFCPAFPRNGRTVYHGHLFVHGQLLHESGMQHHPLNPMTDANLLRVLARQTTCMIGLVNYDDLTNGRIKEKLRKLAETGCRFVITDTCDDEHLRLLAAASAELPLVTGGSGIARYLPDAYRDNGLFTSPPYIPQQPQVAGRSLIVSGSCSTATNEQVAWMRSKCPFWEVDVDSIMSDTDAAVREVIQWATNLDPRKPALISSTASPAHLAKVQEKHGDRRVAQAIEEFLAEVTSSLVKESGVTRLVLAGGETSGAIVKRLGIRSLRIGPEICAGVPWTESLGSPSLALALKSGNFGGEDFFESALRMLA